MEGVLNFLAQFGKRETIGRFQPMARIQILLVLLLCACAFAALDNVQVVEDTLPKVSTAGMLLESMTMEIHPWCKSSISPSDSTLIMDQFTSFKNGLAKGAKPPLSAQEAAAIHAYSSERQQIYKKFNCYLSNAQATTTPNWVKQFQTLLTEALSKLPSYANSTYRGTTLIQKPKKGGVIKNLGFLGSSFDSKAATGFTGCDPCYRVELTKSSGKLIQKFSESASPSEVLIGSNKCWKVLEVASGSESTLKTLFKWAANVKPSDVYVKLEESTCTGREENILEVGNVHEYRIDSEIETLEQVADELDFVL
jgi:hypothetical protein